MPRLEVETIEIDVPAWAPFWSQELRDAGADFFAEARAKRESGEPFDREAESVAGAAMIQAATGRACGSCTLCCVLIPVQAMDKPAGVTCSECDRKGGRCRIYDTRPSQCAGFLCNWAHGEGPPEMRPDLVHAVFDFDPAIQVMRCHVHPSHPEVWREPGPVRDHIRLLHAIGTGVHVIVQNGNKHSPPAWGIPGHGKPPFDVRHPDTGETWTRFRLEHLP